MLSVGPDARRFSSSQNIHVKNELPTESVMYITDNTPQLAQNQDWREADVASPPRDKEGLI